jgi:DNA-binding PadR family transcriptional regulator
MLRLEVFGILWYTDPGEEVDEAMTSVATTKIDLLLLGLLLDRPMHGYELYQQIQAEGIDTWFNVSMAGVYYSLGKLRDQGFVVESRQRGGRSARKSIYRLTEEGRAAFFATMEEQAASQEKTHFDYDVVIYLLNKLPLQRAIPLLEQRQDLLAGQVEALRAALAEERDNGHSPLKAAILDHGLRFLEMEQTWLAAVIRDIQGGGKAFDSPAGSRRGLMILSGDLHHYHLPDLIRLIASGKHSGTLTVTDGAESRTLSFEDGQPICASCLRRGEPPSPPASHEQVLEGLSDLFRWQEGQFTFDQEMGCEEWCVPLRLSAEDLILSGCRWVDNWTIIQRLVPSADTIFERGMALQHIDRLTLMQLEQQLVDAVDGIKDVAAIARELGVTLFEASRAFYCLAAVGVVRVADLDKIRLRRVFREIAELMCSSTITWRTSPDDRTCEEEVNQQIQHLPLCINQGRIEDQADPQLKTEGLVAMYREFLVAQLGVVSQRFGRENARQSFERTLRQLAPELQDIASRHSFDKLL